MLNTAMNQILEGRVTSEKSATRKLDLRDTLGTEKEILC